MTESYNADSIIVLKGLEGVRKRPSMYIGDVSSKGLHHLLWEVIDNCVDEAIAGYCDYIQVIMNPDNSITVADNGRGIPIDIHAEYEKPAVELIMTTLHSGGKFDNKAYKISGGLHGVGISVVNALCDRLVVEIYREGKHCIQEYSRGAPKTELKCVPADKNKSGTSITFLPDKSIFNQIKWDINLIKERLEELSFLVKGLTIELKCSDKSIIFKSDKGLVGLLNKLTDENDEIFTGIIADTCQVDNLIIDFAIRFASKNNILTFANNIKTKEGGTHLSGLKKGCTQAIKKLDNKLSFVSGEDVFACVSGVLSVYLPEPQFEGQTKMKLGNKEVTKNVANVINQAIACYFERYPQHKAKVIQAILSHYKSREVLKKARDLNRTNTISSRFVSKLSDCYSRNPRERELFIVEGDSAGGSAKQARNNKYQAILPIKGKILNVHKTSLNKLLNNKEVGDLVKTLGTGIGPEFDLSKLRYNKIIIMTDADVDGQHIQTLLLSLFYKYFRPIIEEGHLYIAVPPLYRIKYKGKVIYTSDHNVVKKYDTSAIQRFKGLGEMNPEQLWETTMNKDTRTLKRVTIQDAQKCDKLLSQLMAENIDRKNLIMKYIKEFENV